MDLTTSILASESAYGPVTRIAVGPAHVTDLATALVAANRDDLADVVEPGDPGRMVVTAGGVGWPFGGL